MTAAESDHPYDLLGVGIGPFNLSLAALADRCESLSAVFLDEKPEFTWHPGLLLSGTTLQVPFLADLVTMVDPTSQWSFLSYLRAQERLFPFYFAEKFHISRREYNHYCQWAAEALASCHFGRRVTEVSWNEDKQVFAVRVEDIHTARQWTLLARNVVLGVGTTPSLPAALRSVAGKEIYHAASYMDNVDSLREARDVTVIGSGQSGAEVFLDLLRSPGQPGQRLRWLTRSPAFAPMEYSKLGLEHFTPAYIEYFRTLPQESRDSLVPQQWQLYKASSADTLAEIHDLLYERAASGAKSAVTMTPNVEVTSANVSGGAVELNCRHREQGTDFTISTDRVVAATGYAAQRPTCLDPLVDLIAWDDKGRYQVADDYRVAVPGIAGGLYVQNAELHTHGVGAPDLGLGAYRAAVILNAITRKTVLPLPRTSAFTTFGVPRSSMDSQTRSR